MFVGNQMLETIFPNIVGKLEIPYLVINFFPVLGDIRQSSTLDEA
jgi:hypothetical protein